jgi:hypothetical protein
MKGVMFVEKGQAAIIEEEMPVCRPDTMLLWMLYSGMSLGTERMFPVGGNYGGNMPWPKRLAYQLVSEIVECGPEIARFQVGTWCPWARRCAFSTSCVTIPASFWGRSLQWGRGLLLDSGLGGCRKGLYTEPHRENGLFRVF